MTELTRGIDLHPGDCLNVLAALPADHFDACVCDPPYGLEFMGKDWDSFGGAPTGGASFTKDGMGKGFKALPSFTGSPNPSCKNCGGSQRGNNRKGFTRCRCDAPDFPNSRLKQMVAFQDWSETWAREVFRVLKPGAHLVVFGGTRTYHRLACAIEDAGFEIRDQVAWCYGQGFPKSRNIGNGWGTALKPAWEPICLARKPLSKGTVAANVLRWGTGAINVDGCRVATDEALGGGDQSSNTKVKPEGWDRPWMHDAAAKAAHAERINSNVAKAEALGRWPANLVHDGSEEVLAAFPDAPGQQRYVGPEHGRRDSVNCYGDYGARPPNDPLNDSGSAARFFYTSKADIDDRLGSKHPTVKPVDLMQWLVRLVTPPGGLILDPFAGTGTTGEAAWREGMRAVLIEREPEYCTDIRRRMALMLASKTERRRQAHKETQKRKPLDHQGTLVE